MGLMRARSLGLRMVGALCAVVMMLVLGSGSASALLTHQFISSFGSFGKVASIAVDQSTGDVYVYDVGVVGGSIFKFDSEGKPVNFSSTGTNAISNVGEEQSTPFDQIAVDGNPLSPAYGDIYVARGQSSPEALDIYSASGQKVGALTNEVEVEVPASKGSWNDPCGVAVDSLGNVYLGMRARHISEYTPSGAHPYPVNTDYVGSLWGIPKKPCGGLAVDSVGNVFHPGQEENAMIFGPGQFNTTKASASGSVVYSGVEYGAAFDPATDELYMVSKFPDEVLQFGPHGEPFGAPKETFASVGEGAINDGASGIAVNGGSGDLYVSDGTGHINVFGPPVLVPDVTIEPASNVGTTKATVSGTVNPDGVAVTSCVFEYGVGGKYEHSIACPAEPGSGTEPVSETVELTGLASTSEYVVRLVARNAQGENLAGTSFTTFTPPGPPSVGRVSVNGVTKVAATLSGVINPTGLDTTYHFEYGATTSYGTSVPVPDVDIGSGFNSIGVGAAVTGLLPGTEYHARLVGSNSDGTTFGPDHAFETVPVAVVQAEDVSGISLDEATLQTRIAALGDDTTYHFEYGPTSAYGSSVPVPDGDVGTGSATVSQLISGLQSGTTYHYRVVATNALGSIAGEDRTFTTMSAPVPAPADNCPNAGVRAGGSSELSPDCRAYEMVTPLDKNGSNIGGSLTFASEASVDGQRVSFLANAGFADTVGSEDYGLTTYIATRGASGWSSHSVAPPSRLNEVDAGGKKYVVAFTGSLAQTVYEGDSLFASDLGTGSETTNLYREETSSRMLETVTLDKLHCECFTENDLGELLAGSLVGYSSDAGVIVFQGKIPLLPGTLGNKMKLYEWDRGTLRLAGVLPDGTTPTGGSSGVAGNTSNIAEDHKSVSSDGSRVLFTSPADGSAPPQLYMRKNGSSTVWLSRSWTSSPVAEPLGVHFQVASADDTKVLFTSETRLLNSDTGEGEIGIYLYTDTGESAESERKLTLIARVNDQNAWKLDDRPVAGMSEDGSHIYFFNESSTSSIPREGEYLWDNGTLHFVASVGVGISPTFQAGGNDPQPIGAEVRVSTDGRRMAFMASPGSGSELAKPAPQQDDGNGLRAMYVYDEGSGKVVCASCPPDGAGVTADVEVESRLLNLSVIGVGGSPFLQRYMSSDGRFVFFTTTQSLLAQDTNGLADVYEYDVEKNELKLISSGTGETGSWFEDASASGSDVFVLTAQKLTGWDTDNLVDLYDARVNGGFSESSPPPVPCDGDACQGVPSAVPSFTTASGFSGLGNRPSGVATVKKKAKPKKHVKKRHRKGHAGKSRRSRVRKSSRVGG
jgi:hypothetical protein